MTTSQGGRHARRDSARSARWEVWTPQRIGLMHVVAQFYLLHYCFSRPSGVGFSSSVMLGPFRDNDPECICLGRFTESLAVVRLADPHTTSQNKYKRNCRSSLLYRLRHERFGVFGCKGENAIKRWSSSRLRYRTGTAGHRPRRRNA
jgi:hypothetical protein